MQIRDKKQSRKKRQSRKGIKRENANDRRKIEKKMKLVFSFGKVLCFKHKISISKFNNQQPYQLELPTSSSINPFILQTK